jgi:putative tricarboxylic transport membrane protein
MTTARGLRAGEAVLSLGVLALGAFVAVETLLIEVAPSQAAVGPRLFPWLVATGLIVVGLALLREAIGGHIAHERGWELDWRAVGLVAAGLLLQMLIFESLGWIIAATILFSMTAFAFGNRRLVLGAAIGVFLTSLTFVLFNYGLGLTLPIGTAVERVLPAEQDGDQ